MAALQPSLPPEAGSDRSATIDTIAGVTASSESPDWGATNASFIPDSEGAQPETAAGRTIAERLQHNLPSLKLPQEQVDHPPDQSQAAMSVAHPYASAGAAATLNHTSAQLDPATIDHAVQPKSQAPGFVHPPKATAQSTAGPVRAESRSEANPAVSFPALPWHEMSELAHAADRRVAGPVPHAGAPASSQMLDPFASIDGETNAPAPTWIHASARHAEAGYLDPALGWIGVRADTAASGVHASLVPASGEAAQVLGTHLAGLNNHLAEQRGHATTVTMAAPQDFAGAGTNAQQQQERQSSRDARSPATKEQALSADRAPERSVLRVSARAPAQAYAAGARYISVMA